MQLLRAIAESPAPNLGTTPAKAEAKAKAKAKEKETIFSQAAGSPSVNSNKIDAMFLQRNKSRAASSTTNGKGKDAGAVGKYRAWKGKGSRAEKETATSTTAGAGKRAKVANSNVNVSAAGAHHGAAAAAAAAAAAKAAATTAVATIASPAASRKRPRSSPESGGASAGSVNPFKAFGHRSRPPPPSPSSRLGVTAAAIKGGSPPSTPFPASSRGDVGLDPLLHENGDVEGHFAVAPTPSSSTAKRSRSSPKATTTMTSTPSPSSSRGGDGSVTSPVLLVDLSQEEDEEVEDAQGGGKREPADASAGALVEVVEVEGSKSRPEAVGGVPGGGGDGASSLTLSPGLLRQGGASREVGESPDAGTDSDDVFDVELGECEGKDGGEGDGERKGRKGEEGEKARLFASTLFFMVSSNTGRVHLYKKQEEEGGLGLDGSFEDEEDKKPQHCRLVALSVLCIFGQWAGGQGRSAFSPPISVFLWSSRYDSSLQFPRVSESQVRTDRGVDICVLRLSHLRIRSLGGGIASFPLLTEALARGTKSSPPQSCHCSLGLFQWLDGLD